MGYFMKARIAFDTLAYANRLKAAGADPKLAEAQAEASADMMANLLEDTLATKQELLITNQKILETKQELRQEIQEVKTDMVSMESRLMQIIKDLETRLTLRLGGIMMAGLTVFTAILSLFHLIH
jgi:hypothetical protein